MFEDGTQFYDVLNKRIDEMASKYVSRKQRLIIAMAVFDVLSSYKVLDADKLDEIMKRDYPEPWYRTAGKK
jgi:hypothetical protein